MTELKQNEATWERVVRVVAGLALLWVALYSVSSPIWIWILAILALALIITGAAGYSPSYQFLNIGTKK